MSQTPEPPPPGPENGPEYGPQNGYDQGPGYGPGYEAGYGTGYGPGYGAGYGPGYGPSQVPPTNGKATAAIITGISSLLLSWCCGLGVVGVVAIVLGVKARAEIRASGGRQQGDGLALGGIITGAVAVVLGILILVLIALAIAGGFQYDTSTNNAGTQL